MKNFTESYMSTEIVDLFGTSLGNPFVTNSVNRQVGCSAQGMDDDYNRVGSFPSFPVRQCKRGTGQGGEYHGKQRRH